MKKIVFYSLLGLVVTLISCSKNSSDDDGSGPYAPPTLNFEFNITGHSTMSESFTSPENSNTQGGHLHAVISAYSSTEKIWSLIGNGQNSSGQHYAWAISFEVNDLEEGTYTVTHAHFGTGEHGYPNLISGTMNIVKATIEYNLPVSGSYHSADGNFSIQLQDQSTPANAITFEGTFTGLHVTST